VKTKKIKKIMKAFERSSLDQLDITYKKMSIHMQKPQTVHDFSCEKKQEDPISPKCEPTWIHSPLVGTLYLKTTFDSEPMAFIGKRVQKNDIVCIIETMKVFNEIKSPIDGVIVEINVADGCMVEYHQPLVAVRCDD
jgi:acetyl-CoA carboxylase biotin carboxyl carrier protein